MKKVIGHYHFFIGNHFFFSIFQHVNIIYVNSSDPERWRMLRTITNPIVARPQSALNYLNDHNLIINDFVQVLNTKLDSTNQQVSLDKFEIDLKLLALECLF